jgi:hypothetical protein
MATFTTAGMPCGAGSGEIAQMFRTHRQIDRRARRERFGGFA